MKLNKEKGIATGQDFTIKYLPIFYRSAPFIAHFNKRRPFLVTEMEKGQVIRKEYFKDAETAAESLHLNGKEVIHLVFFFRTVLNGL